ncbi:J domain-containing protein [Variovorax sp. PCZ-1]|uniref:J domain-containing protein n=1 Tax=Variovorax sp. PCZ-1 TaxID=2835533 RepID=UPI001BD0245B|nr:J domain-containing protein [Variovorax sp. PCZ-1]MBS7807125.1 hypothetical protein [Variovorax sp. PCZ-1]
MSASALAVTDAIKNDLVTQAKAQATSPLQLKFADALQRIDAIGQRVQFLDALYGQYRSKFGQHLPPLRAEQDRLSRQMVVFLHERLQRPDAEGTQSLTANHRKSIGRLIVSLAKDYALQGDAQMRAIHDAYSHETIEEMDAANKDGMLDWLEAMGVDLSPSSEKGSAAEMAQAALKAVHEKMVHQEKIEEQRKARRDEKRAARKKADPKAQARLAEKELAAQEAQSALKNIYRQLARQLHPDRADNDTQRAISHDLMSEANTAYERQDLLALLQLQLRASQIDASAMGTVAEEKLESWIALLRAQAKDLTQECMMLERQMMHEFGLLSHQSLTAENLEALLQATLQQYDEALHLMRNDLEMIKNDADLKRWAKANSKELERHDAILDDELMNAMMMNTAPRHSAKKKR